MVVRNARFAGQKLVESFSASVIHAYATVIRVVYIFQFLYDGVRVIKVTEHQRK